MHSERDPQSHAPYAEPEVVAQTPRGLSAHRLRRLQEALRQPVRASRYIIAACVVVYLLMLALDFRLIGEWAVNPRASIFFGANWAPLTMEAGQWWRLVTSTFMHANLLHIGINGYALYILGSNVERLAGSARMWILVVGSGVAGSLASLAFTGAPSVGISGGVFGLVGAIWAISRKFSDWLPAQVAAQLKRAAIMIVGINLVLGFLIPNIDNAAHIGGLVGGALIMLMMESAMSDTPSERRRSQIASIVLGGVVIAAFALAAIDAYPCSSNLETMDRCYAERLSDEAIEALEQRAREAAGER